MSRWLRRAAVVLALLALVGLGVRVIVGRSTRARLEAVRNAFEATHGTRVPADLAPEPVPADDNVAPALLALVADLGDDNFRGLYTRVAAFETLKAQEWTEDQWRTAEQFLAACGGVERYEDLARRRRSDFELDYSQGWSTPLPPFVEILGVARCALIHGRVGLAKGDQERFRAAYLALSHIARGLANEPMLISQALAIAVDRHRHYLLHPALETAALELATIESLLAVDEGPPFREGVATALEAEALLIASTPSRVILKGISDEGRSFYFTTVGRALSYLMEPTGDLIRVAAIENRAREIESLERQAAELFRALDDGTFYDAEHRLRDQLAPNIEDILLKAYAADTVDRLVRSALELARDVAAGQSELMVATRFDPMSGEPLSWRTTDTHLVVSAPSAAALWEDRAQFAGSLPPVFEWSVATSPPG